MDPTMSATRTSKPSSRSAAGGNPSEMPNGARPLHGASGTGNNFAGANANGLQRAGAAPLPPPTSNGAHKTAGPQPNLEGPKLPLPQDNAMHGNGGAGNNPMMMGPGPMGGPPGFGNGGPQGYPQPMYNAGGSAYGSMDPGGFGAADGQASGDDFNMSNNYGSAYGMGDPMMGGGSMYGGMGAGPMGSMYGMGGPMMGSMYGMGGPMMGGSMYGGGNPMMGSMYGAGGPMMGSMYGGGNPAMGSMYDFGGPMGSMYGGMGPGAMSSMYGGMGLGRIGSMMARSGSFSSYGGGSLYGSMSGGSMMNIGGSMRTISGMFGGGDGYEVRHRRDHEAPAMAKMLRDDTEARSRKLVTATKRMLELEAAAKNGTTATATTPAAAAAAATPNKAAANGAAAEEAAKKDEDATKKDAAAPAKEESKTEADKKDAGREAAETAKESEGKKREADKAKAVSESDLTALEDSNAIYGIVIVEDAKTDRIKVEKAEGGHKVVLQGTAAGKPTECKAAEVLRGPEADVKKSAVLTTLAAHVKSGHNVSLIALDKPEKMTPSVAKTTVAFFVNAFERLAADEKWRAVFTATAVAGPNKCRDLTAKDASSKDVVFGSNPICGPCIMDNTPTGVKELPAVEKYVTDVLAKKTEPQEIVFIQAIVHIRKHKDLFLCSMNAFIVRDVETAEAVSILDDRRVPVPVLRTAIGGATRTAVVLALTGAASAEPQESAGVRVAATVCAKENLAPRSGNVPRFIEYTDEQIAKIEKDIAKLSGSDRERRAHMVEKMRTMANDAKKLVADPEVEASVYQIHVRGGSTAAPAKEPAPTKETAPAKEAAREAVPAKDAPAAAAAATRAAPIAAVPAADAAAAKDVAAAKDAVVAPASAPTPRNTNPFTSIHRLVYLHDSKGTAGVGKAVEIVVDGEKKAYDVDECLDCPAGAKTHPLQESKELERMAAILSSGYNVSLLGAELTAPVQPQEQMTWRYVKHLLSAVVAAPPTPELTQEVTVHMCVLHERQVIADLVSGATEPRRLVVATSPLFGPVVHESAGAKVRNPEEVAAVLKKALATAQPVVAKADGALIVMTAVVKQIVKDDVRLASVFAVSAGDMSPYNGVIERNPKYSRSLFTYSLGGPSSTAILVNASRNMDQAGLATALSAQRSVSHMKVPAPRNGSVKEFVQYAKDSLERQSKKAAGITGQAEKEQSLNAIRRLSESLKDHEKMLAHQRTTEPHAYPPESAAAAVTEVKPQSATEAVTAAAVAPLTAVAGAKSVPAQPQHAVSVQPKEEGAAPAPAAVAAAEQKPEQAMAAQEEVARQEKAKEAKAKEAAAATLAAAQPVRFLAVITEEIRQGLPVKEGWSVQGEGTELVVTDVEGPHRFVADEVVTRANRSSAISSTVLEELRSTFLGGRNVALLTADTRGSAASLEMVDRTVRGILSKLAPSAALHMSLCAFRENDNTTLDTLKEGDTFKPTEVTTSPLFGPIVKDAKFEKIDVAERFVKLMGAGLRKCGESRACVVLQLLQVDRKEEEQDVRVSSLLAIMCPGDIGVYRKAAEKPVKERGLLALALGGSCFTVYAAGLTKQPVDEGCLLLPRLSQNFNGAVRNTKPRHGSVKRFIEHTKGAVAQVQHKMKKTSSAEEKAKMQTYLETVQSMLTTSEAYLADPVDKIPPTYALNHRLEHQEL